VNNSVKSFLFHQPDFVFRNREHSVISFEEHSARIYFSRIGDSLVSMDRAPFGSFIVDQDSNENHLLALVNKIVDWSNLNGISNLLIRSFPEIYNPEQFALTKGALSKSGFVVKHTDITQVISVSSEPMNLNTHKERRLRKATASGFTFNALPPDFLEESYHLIVESRQNKSYPVTMSLEDLRETFRQFPNAYLLFGVFDKNKLIATAVCIEVNAEIFYCFYIGDYLPYRPYSPVTFLVYKIYEFCRSRKFEILDLGLSTDKGTMNNGLYTFKKSFGSIASEKLTFFKEL
jgi:hypothetical protein